MSAYPILVDAERRLTALVESLFHAELSAPGNATPTQQLMAYLGRTIE